MARERPNDDAKCGDAMNFDVRPMALHETDLIIDYFHGAAPEHLEKLGVDPTRLPAVDAWRKRYELEYSRPIEHTTTFMVIWQEGGCPIGFSTTDKIIFGKSAYMHLHIVDSNRRAQGAGAQCVRKSIDIYFECLKLKSLFCEPNAFNVAPNRTLQRAGFKYLKTHQTVPGPLNFHQPVNRWAIERD